MTKKVGFKIFVFVLIVVVLDQFLGLLLASLYNSQRTGQNHSLTYTFETSKDDILILGSSRALNHYDSRIIEDSMQMSCYNVGSGGQGLLFADAQLKVILKRYSPKIVVLEINTLTCFEYNPKDYERLSVLRPYFKRYKELYPCIDLLGPYEKYKLLSAIYPYNSMIIDILRFNTNIDQSRKWMFNGYIPILDRQIKKENLPKMKTLKLELLNEAVDNLKIQSLKSIVDNCRKNNVRLILVNSPMFMTLDDVCNYPSTHSSILLSRIIKKEKIEFYDFATNYLFLGHDELFADQKHLNEKGSAKFSRMIISYMRK